MSPSKKQDKKKVTRKAGGITAVDIMSKVVLTVPLSCSLSGLAMILHENGISGAPVVDDDGELVGVVSQSDLVEHGMKTIGKLHVIPPAERNEEPADEEDYHSPAYFAHMDETDARALKDKFIEEDYGDTQVCDIYTPYMITAGPDATLATLASLMVGKKVHRILIVQDRRVVGIVTSLDVMKTLARSKERDGRSCFVHA